MFGLLNISINKIFTATAEIQKLEIHISFRSKYIKLMVSTVKFLEIFERKISY